MNGRIIVHHYGVTGLDIAPVLPVLFARDLVHVLFQTDDGPALRLGRDNPNASLFRAGADADPAYEFADLISVAMPLGDPGPLARSESASLGDVICVIVRSALVPLYLGDALPAPLAAVLRTGFRFGGFLHPLSQMTSAAEVRVDTLPTPRDAVFLRDIEHLRRPGQSQDTVYLKAMKLAFLSIAVGQLAYGLEVLRHAHRVGASPDLQRALGYRNYDRFLKNLAAAAENSSFYLENNSSSGSSPPEDIVAQVDGVELMRLRFMAVLDVVRGRIPPLMWVRELWSAWDPMAYWMLPFYARKALGVLRRLWRAWKVMIKGVPLTAPFTPGPDWAKTSPLESALDFHGFWVIARESYATRMSLSRR
jgi:hypothetical protein